jgi:cytochrome c oxidase subunit II
VNLFSNNVIHSFWVPNVTGKTDVVPGHDNTKWFVVNSSGTYQGLCAEYCGTQHANMKFNVIAEDANAFQTWIHAQEQAAATPLAGTMASAGEAIFKNTCTTCHGIVGVDQQASSSAPYGYPDTPQDCNGNNDPTSECLLGPNLTHFGSRTLIAGGVLEQTDPQGCANPNAPDLYQTCALAQWLQNPQQVKPGNDMTIAPLSDTQIRELVAYLETLK